MGQLESALIIQLTDTIKWGAALPPVTTAGTLTPVDPGQPFDVTQYARRDREFQHRDMINAAAVAKVSIFAETVWAGTVPAPTLQGVSAVTDLSGTNVTLPPIDPSQIGTPPLSTTEVRYVLNANIPFDSIQVTDKDLYARDLLLYETLARAATIFPNNPPIVSVDPSQSTVSSTSVWATAQGSNTMVVPNSATPMTQALFRDADTYLAGQDNQIAAYVSRVCQALKNPFDYATRVYVNITGTDSREVEAYVLTNNVFQGGLVYAAGEQVTFAGSWFQAINTTNDFPPSANWMGMPSPTLRQFLADPSLSSRNRLIYDTQGKTLQWFRETLDTVHQPQIVGFFVPGILPGQTIQTVPAVPEQKDAQFYAQKAARICLVAGTYSSEQVISPLTQTGSVTGGLATVFQDVKLATLMSPDTATANFKNIICNTGSYVMNCLVRPATMIEIAGGDNQQGSVDTTDGGVSFIPVTGTTFNWQIPLPSGGWQLVIEFANYGTALTTAFPIRGAQSSSISSQNILNSAVPLYYTDMQGNPLPQFTVVNSPPIAIVSTGQSYNFGITWVNALPNTGQQFHVHRLKFISTDGHLTSHYLMQASWRGAFYGTNATSVLDVYGQHEMPDVMPFSFFLSGTDSSPTIDIKWVPKSNAWIAQSYNAGDQVLYQLGYWQATAATQPADIPGQSPLWIQVATEPQLPLIIEQVQLQKLVATTVTPATQGFEGFRQDMLERALRADQDAYRTHLVQTGTNVPEFRTFGSVWDISATGSWMRFMETYAARLREVRNVTSISLGRQYLVLAIGAGNIVYNGVTYSNGARFFGVTGVTTFTPSGSVRVDQIGAYTISRPGDLGKTGLIPDGLEFNQSAGTVIAWYNATASYPTHQAIQPWMIEQGLYVARNAFLSPDGNATPVGGPSNPLSI